MSDFGTRASLSDHQAEARRHPHNNCKGMPKLSSPNNDIYALCITFHSLTFKAMRCIVLLIFQHKWIEFMHAPLLGEELYKLYATPIHMTEGHGQHIP